MQLLQPSAKKGLLSLPSQVPNSRAFSSPRLLLPTLIRSKLLCMEQRLSEDRHGYVELRTCYVNERPCVAFLPLGSVLRSMLEDSGLAWVSDKVDGPATGWRMEWTGWSGILDLAVFVLDCVALDQAPSFFEPLCPLQCSHGES